MQTELFIHCKQPTIALLHCTQLIPEKKAPKSQDCYDARMLLIEKLPEQA
jgi:hypothetical protein